MKNNFLEISRLTKTYGTGENTFPVLKGVNMTLDEGKICVILGPSGSGKSTLLNIVGALDKPDGGSVKVDGKEIVGLNARQLSEYRKDYLGFVFQFYNLIPNLTVQENIQVCEYLSSDPLNINELLNTLGLQEHRHKFPSQLSGGQQQRCAMARALIKNPRLLLCDEPTGALDYSTSREMLSLIETINRKYNMTIVIVTHNIAIQEMAHKVIKIRDGNISEEIVNEHPLPAAELVW